MVFGFLNGGEPFDQPALTEQRLSADSREDAAVHQQVTQVSDSPPGSFRSHDLTGRLAAGPLRHHRSPAADCPHHPPAHRRAARPRAATASSWPRSPWHGGRFSAGWGTRGELEYHPRTARPGGRVPRRHRRRRGPLPPSRPLRAAAWRSHRATGPSLRHLTVHHATLLRAPGPSSAGRSRTLLDLVANRPYGDERVAALTVSRSAVPPWSPCHRVGSGRLKRRSSGGRGRGNPGGPPRRRRPARGPGQRCTRGGAAARRSPWRP